MPKSEKIFMPQQPSLVRTTIHTSLSHKFRNIGTKNGVTLSKNQDGLDLSKVSNVGTGLETKKINMLALNLPRKLSIRPQNKTESLYLHDNKKWQDLESGDSNTKSIPDQGSAKSVAGQQDNFIQNSEQVPILSEHNIQKPLDIQYPPSPPQHPSQHTQIEMMTVHAPAHAATPKAVGTIGSDISLLLREQNTYIKDNAKASIDMCEVHDIYHAEDTSTSRSSVLTSDNTLPSVSGLASEPPLQAPRENTPKTKPVPASMRWTWQVWSNRIFACAFAVVLLWLTSLQLAIDLAQANISVPPFSFISDTCVESYNQMNSQKQKYSDCSSRQLKQCQRWLDNSITQEIHRVQGIQSAQREMLENATAQNQQCSLVWAGFVTQFQTYETSALANVTSTGHVPTSTTASLPKAAMNPLAYNPICTGAEIYTLRNALSLVHVQKQLQLAAQQKSARSQEQQNADAQQRSNNQFQEKKRTGLLGYADRVDGRFHRMTSYTAALNSYNQDYISNHTLAMQQLSKQIIREVTEGIQGLPSINMHLDNLLLPLQGLLNCFPPNTAAGQTCNLGVIDEIEQTYQLIQHEMKLNIQVAQQSMQAFQNEVKDFVDSVRQALGEADDFFRAVAGTAGVIAWVVSQVDFLNLDTDLCGKSTPDWCHFTSMNWKVPALYIPNLPTFTPMRDASFLWKGLKDAVSQVQLDLQLESLGIKDELIDLFDQVDVSISIDTRFAPDDYHPPKYPAPAPTPAPNQGSGTSTDNYNLSNTTNLSNSPSTGLSDDARRQTQDSNAFRGNITSLYTAEPPVIRPLSLNTTVNITDRFHDSPLQSNGTLIRGNGFASNYIFQPIQYLANQLQSTFSIQWARFQPGPFDFTTLLDSISGIESYFHVFDYIYRGVQTFYIVQRHWSRSASSISPLDRRVSKGLSCEIPAVAQTVLRYFHYIGLPVMILLTLVGMTLAALLKMYFEAYNSYTAACVLGVSNSTFLIRNMNSLAFNYASMEGNGVLSNGLANYNSRSASACTSHYAPSVQEYNTYWEQVSKLNSTYYESTNPQYDKVQLVAKCMSKASLQHVDQYLQGQCCDVSSQEPNTLSTAAGSSISADKHQMWGGSLWPGYKQCNGTLANERFCPVYNSSLERAEATAATTLIMINRFINDSNLLPIPPPSWAMHSPACQYKQWALRSAQLWNFTSQAQQPDQSDRVTKSWRQTEMAMQTSNSTIDRSNDLENPSFRCEALPTCEVTCGGPDAALISAMSQSCSCVIEWYAHSHVLRGLFVLIIYIVLNISRICITKAVLRVFWRALHVPIFEVFLNCDEHGTMLDQSGKPIIPEDLAAEGSNSHTLVSKGCSGENTENATQTLSSDSDALAANQPPSSAATGTQAQIAALIKREVDFHVKSGMYLMLFGIAINAIWIYLLQQVETAVVYRPHHQEIVY